MAIEILNLRRWQAVPYKSRAICGPRYGGAFGCTMSNIFVRASAASSTCIAGVRRADQGFFLPPRVFLFAGLSVNVLLFRSRSMLEVFGGQRALLRNG
jgi:hypothetical protein